MAGASLDMSLDDLIKNNKKSGGGDAGQRGGRGGRGSGPGPTRRFNNRGAHRATPYGGPKGGDVAWRNDMYVDQGIGNVGGRASAMETGTKLYISNLDYGVSNEDIKELFAEVGDLKKYSIHYDRSGRSKGTAEIVYSRKQDALAAVKRYNNVQLDGKPMKIEIVGLNLVAPVPPMANNYTGNMNSFPRGGQARNAGFGRPRGGANGGAARGGAGRGFARGRGRGRGGREEKISADDLDADLEKDYVIQLVMLEENIGIHYVQVIQHPVISHQTSASIEGCSCDSVPPFDDLPRPHSKFGIFVGDLSSSPGSFCNLCVSRKERLYIYNQTDAISMVMKMMEENIAILYIKVMEVLLVTAF
uniref:THO complex subunit 4A n=1 Tax=Tanacetum cinerariifolium TaxID=118510 RepID=A0A6L2M2C0_TANCI|nr:THO complex subunit 4A [Tanacetum cinerariifolium]